MPADPASSTRELADRLVELMEADSSSGREDAGLPALLGQIEALAPDRIRRREVAPGRTNLLAVWGSPRVLFTTHLDTVPPWIPPTRRGDDVVHGRGANDAKGQIVCQLEAIRQMRARGRTGFAFLGLVGEESDAAGANDAAAFAPDLAGVELIVNGEPTSLLFATGQRGYLHLRVSTTGVLAHSGSPELGRHAIWPLLDWMIALRQLGTPADAELGAEVWNLGTIRGGRAANVVPDQAEAEILCRTLPGSDFLERVRRTRPAEDAEITVLVDEAADRYPKIAGFPYAAMPFGSDLPALRRVLPGARAALVGPGSIRTAHTEDEQISLLELRSGAALLRRLAETVEEVSK